MLSNKTAGETDSVCERDAALDMEGSEQERGGTATTREEQEANAITCSARISSGICDPCRLLGSPGLGAPDLSCQSCYHVLRLSAYTSGGNA
jgi:hypothetical protein